MVVEDAEASPCPVSLPSTSSVDSVLSTANSVSLETHQWVWDHLASRAAAEGAAASSSLLTAGALTTLTSSSSLSGTAGGASTASEKPPRGMPTRTESRVRFEKILEARFGLSSRYLKSTVPVLVLLFLHINTFV